MRQSIRALAIVFVIALVSSAMAVPTSAASSDVRLTRVLGGYSHPVLVTHAPGSGRTIFIVEQTGKIKRATYGMAAGRSWARSST